jgi:hypothetical protein
MECGEVVRQAVSWRLRTDDEPRSSQAHKSCHTTRWNGGEEEETGEE